MCSPLWRASKTAALAALASLIFQTAAFGQTAADAEVKRLTAEKVAVGSQLAIVSKTLGDEQFIDGDRQAARRSYAIAAGAVLQAMIDPTLLMQADAESLSLLQRDIAYRTVLIDANLPFWGLEFTSSADIPVLRMTELEALSTKLGSLNTDIQKLVDRLRSLNLQQLKAESDSRRQEVQADISQLEQTQGEVNTEFHAKARADAYGRVTRLQVLEDELVQQQREAEQGIKAIEKKNQQLVLEGLSAAAGIPPEVSKSIASGNVNEALKQAATSYAGSPEFAELLTKAKGVAPAIGKLYEQAKTIADKANEDIEFGRKIANTVREPSLANLGALGTKLLERMPADQKAALEKAVVDSKPVGMLVAATKKEGAILEALGRDLAGQGQAIVGEAIGQLAKEHADLRVWYRDVLNQITQASNTSPALSSAVVDSMLRDWSKGFVRSLPPSATAALQANLNVANSDDLAKTLATRGASALPAFSVSAGTMQIASLGISLDLAAQLRTLAPRDLPAFDVPALQQRFGTLVGVGQGQVMKCLLDGASQFGLESVTAAGANGRAASAVFDGVFTSMNAQAKAGAAAAMAGIEAGRQMAYEKAEGVGAEGASTMQRITTPEQQPKESELDVAKKMLAGPLAAAFPGAAAAVKVAEYIAGTFEMGRLSDKIQKASDKINGYVEEEMHLRRLIEQSQTSEELAKIDTEVAKLHRKQATSDLKYLKATADALTETEDELRKKIVGYRMSQFFYVAEELRSQYAQLSRSVSLWRGATPGPRDYLQERMRNDPRRLRYAVDPYIRAFDIYEKDQQRQRQDIDQLATYWDFAVTQLRTFCTSPNIGCSRSTPSLGNIGQTEEISLKKALSGEWEEFKQWQRSKPEAPFTFALLVRPGLHQIELEPYKIGVRVVHAMLTRSRPGATSEQASTISVTHPGFAFIPTGAGFVAEALAPETKEGLDPLSRMESNLSYANRWGQGTFTRREFEGHGLFTVWLIKVGPGDANFELNDIKMRFAYQYVATPELPLSLKNRLDKRSVEVLEAEGGSPIRVKLRSLAMLGDRGALDRYVDEWQRGMGSAATVKWKHGNLGGGEAPPAPYDTKLLQDATALSGGN